MDILKASTAKDKEPIMTDEQFNLIRGLVLKEFGFVIKGDKRLTIHTKLSHRLRILNMDSYFNYYQYIVSDPTKVELYNLMSHITNNETFFLREQNQLNVLMDILPEIKKNRMRKDQKKINILSAGCSSGEEVYTLNILLLESGLFAWGWETGIIGIDISRTAIKTAEKAIYTRNSFRMLNGNEDFAKRYFEFSENKFILRKPYQRNTSFKHANILNPESFVGIEDLDVIFCRNILIYMSDEAMIKIAENFYKLMNDDGYLFLGSSESLLQKTDLFIPECIGGIIVYRKNPLSVRITL